MSFNARTSSLPHKKYGWANRKQLVIDIIKKYAPDIVGFQEVQRDQLEDLVTGLSGYGCHHQGWQNVDVKQELLPMFYMKERVNIVASGVFWLNETPDIPRIDDGDGEVMRACTWFHASLKAKSGPCEDMPLSYAVFNTHFDHQKETRREKEARIVLERIASTAAVRPAILIGDLNTPPGSTTYKMLGSRFIDAFVNSSTPRTDGEITCHCFTGATRKSWFRSAFQWIDHILMDKSIKCTNAIRIMDIGHDPHPMYPTDHWPVMAELE